MLATLPRDHTWYSATSRPKRGLKRKHPFWPLAETEWKAFCVTYCPGRTWSWLLLYLFHIFGWTYGEEKLCCFIVIVASEPILYSLCAMRRRLFIETRHLVLDSELQCGPGSRRARSTVPSTYAAQKKLSKQNATSLRQESRFTYCSSWVYWN